MSDDFSCIPPYPLSIILDKPGRDFVRDDFLKVIKQKHIERITFHFTALDGRLKELKFPIPNSKRAERILAEGERVDGSSLFKGLVDTALSDLYVVPDYKTAFLNPFDAGSLDFICRYLTRDGKRAGFPLDSILARACDFFSKRTGLELYALGELEFFLISENRQNIFPLQRQKGYQESGPFMKSGEILSEILRYLNQITGEVKYGHSEVGSIDVIHSDLEEIQDKRAEQLEVEFLPRPVEETADALVLARWLIRNVGFKYGCIATFTPKIEEGVAGNGLHFHLELKKDGKNIMVESKRKLSDQAVRLIGGLCEYADSLTAFGNTVSSSYMRLIPNQEAPTHIFWSDLDRRALIRVPLGWSNLKNLARTINPLDKNEIEDQESRQTIELRTPDGSAIIHLLLAGIVMAAEWGLTNDQSLKLAEKLYTESSRSKEGQFSSAFSSLPSSCMESSRILLKKRDIYEREGIFPPSVIDYVIKLLQAENDELIRERLEKLSENERLKEIRRIMHKDLHRH